MNKLEADIDNIRKEIRLAKWIPSVVSVVCFACSRFFAPSAPISSPAPIIQPSSENHNTSVNVGGVKEPGPQRDWLTVAEVAKKEGKSERTITDYITAGRIESERTGRAYRIPKSYTVQPPQFADNGGN